MQISKHLLLQPLILLAFAISGNAAITIYDNPFVVPGGTGGGSNLAITSTIPSWLVYTGTGGAQHTANSRVFISDRPFKDAPANTYGIVAFDGTGGNTIPKFTFTTGLNIDSATPELTLSWLQGNGGDGSGALRLAVQVGGQWYASSSVYTTPGQTAAEFASLTSTTAVSQAVLFSGSASNWNVINFTPGSALSMGGQAVSDLSGAITGVGFFTVSASTTNNIRLADFKITAVPEPGTTAAGALLAMAVLVKIARQRRQRRMA